MELIATAPRTWLNPVYSRTRTIRARLMLVVVALVIPGWLGIAAVIYSFYHYEREHIALGTVATARTLMAAVDHELLDTITATQYVASSRLLASGDFAGFQAEATKLLPLVFGHNFVLADTSGQQIVNTLRPYGEPLPREKEAESQRKVFETRKPVISNVFIGPVMKKPVVAITVPVFEGSEAKYTLSVGVLPDDLEDLLFRQRLPSNWITTILDTSGVSAARTSSPERFVGKAGSPLLLKAMQGASEGVVENVSVEGIPVYGAYSRSEFSNWTVAIGIPIADLSGGLNQLLLVGSASAAALLIFGLLLAGQQSTQIARAVQNLISPAVALGRGEVPNIPLLRVQEADDVAQALVQASHLLQKRTGERDRAKEKQEQAQILTGMMDEFVANVSHELRTPLTSIAGSLGLLAGGATGQLPASAVRLVSIARSNAERLVRLVNDILDIGKIESGNMTFDFAPINLGVTARQAIDANQALAEAQKISIRLDVASPDCIVRADADRLIQIFTNLLSNAIKFSPEGGEVVVTVRQKDGMGCILVRDHGSGIPAAFRSRVFDKFAQAEIGNARQKTGSGLGLSIVAKIAKQHGGAVGFSDAPGGGMIFQVDIPVWTGKIITALPA